MKVVLRVRLKVPDTTALSALDVLRRKMGYGDKITEIAREDWWLFEVTSREAADASDMVREWAGRCTALVNPNKHRAAIDAVTQWPPRGDHARTKSRRIKILVRDREDVRAESMFGFLREALSISNLVSLESGTLWTLEPGPGVTDGLALASEIAATRSRTCGLLGNPHSQTVEVWQ